MKRMLEKHLEKLTQDSNPRILFPFCGKSLDMNWLASKGYEIVGVEYVEDAVQQFFAEQNIKYEQEQVKDFKLFKATFLTIWFDWNFIQNLLFFIML